MASLNSSLAQPYDEESTTKHITRSSTGTINVISTFMKKVSTSPQEGTKPKITVAYLHEQIIAQNAIIDTQSITINNLIHKMNEQNAVIEELSEKCGANKKENDLLNVKLKALDWQIKENTALIAIKDRVSEVMSQELSKLQQYTRRYSVSVAGVEKKRGEKGADLKKEVEKLINDVDSSTTMVDVDKFHRNGPLKEGKQDLIIRFKSHSAKEQFYKNRKSLGEESRVKIRPSLSPRNKTLLHKAEDYLKEIADYGGMSNPPYFVLANIHGEIQVKFKEESKKGLFVTFNSIKELSTVIASAQHEDTDLLIDNDFAVYDASDPDSEDDMGFGQFD